MELRDYIKQGIIAAGCQKQLALRLGVSSQQLTNAKGHRAGIPNDAAAKLAQLLKVSEIDVIAASELATEHNEEKRAFWLSFANPAKTARVAGIGAFLAYVTNFVTSHSPNLLISQSAEAYATVMRFVLCKIHKKFYAVRNFCKSA